MAINPFENMYGGGGYYGGGSPFQRFAPAPAPANQTQTNTTYDGGATRGNAGRSQGTAGNTSTTTVNYGPGGIPQNTTPAFVPRQNFTQLGVGNQNPYTFQRPQMPWQQQGPWGMANRTVNPYAGPNTADPRFQNPNVMMAPWMNQNIWQYGAPGMPQMGNVNQVNPYWQSLMQQRYLPSQNPYAPMQPNQQQNFWLPGMNPYANQQPTGTAIPSTRQGLVRRNAG